MILTDLVLLIGLACSTLVLEEVALLTGIALVAAEEITSLEAFIALSVGIIVTDLIYYAAGRGLFHFRFVRGIRQRLVVRKAERRIREHAIPFLIIARMTPGLRFPVFVAAGLVRVKPSIYIPISLFSGVTWTFAMLALGGHVTELVEQHLGLSFHWALALLAVGVFLPLHLLSRRFIS